jgi:hypothetical protein
MVQEAMFVATNVFRDMTVHMLNLNLGTADGSLHAKRGR